MALVPLVPPPAIPPPAPGGAKASTKLAPHLQEYFRQLNRRRADLNYSSAQARALPSDLCCPPPLVWVGGCKGWRGGRAFPKCM